MKMYKQQKAHVSRIRGVETNEGESMIKKMQRIMTTGEPITDKAPIIYQERKDGIDPLTNIKTDRFELAAIAKNKEAGERIARRQSYQQAAENKGSQQEQG